MFSAESPLSVVFSRVIAPGFVERWWRRRAPDRVLRGFEDTGLGSKPLNFSG